MTTPDRTAVDPLITRLVAARKAAGLSMRDLAEATGLAVSHISYLESGQKSPTLPTLRRWMQALGLQPDAAALSYDSTMPMFTLKAKDALAEAAIVYYRKLCIQEDLTEQAYQVSLALDEILAWRAEHADRVKMPDHPHVPQTATVGDGGGVDPAETPPRTGCPWCDCGFYAEPHPCPLAAAVDRTLDAAEATADLNRNSALAGPASAERGGSPPG